MQTVTIKGDLPKLNEIIDLARTHWAVSAKSKKENTELVRLQCLRMKPITSPVTMSFEWHVSSNHDPDNISSGGRKVILDGMVESGKLPNDNQKWIVGFEGDYLYKCAKGQEKCIVTICEYEE